MGFTLAALKGKLGSTEYYTVVMPAQELVSKVVIPSEVPDWETMTMEEREQRDINYRRVVNQIVPYLTSNKDRFFGSIICAATGLQPDAFEEIQSIVNPKTPKLYKDQTKQMGFLTFTGGESLIPLDGQHRVKAIQFAISGRDNAGKDITGVRPNAHLAQEQISVIIVPHSKDKARKIFTKVNRYAKPTSKGQNLVTDDEDSVAIISRHVANEIIGPNLVTYKSTTLRPKDPYFTTLAIIDKCNEAILKESFGSVNRTQPIKEEEHALWEDKCSSVWRFIVANIDPFKDLLSDKTESGNKKRIEIRKSNLLARPVPQYCLVSAFSRLTSGGPPTRMTEKDAITKLNSVDWTVNNPLWPGVLLKGSGSIETKNQLLVIRLLCYMCGQTLTAEEKKGLREDYQNVLPQGEKKKDLPDLLK